MSNVYVYAETDRERIEYDGEICVNTVSNTIPYDEVEWRVDSKFPTPDNDIYMVFDPDTVYLCIELNGDLYEWRALYE